MDKITTIIKEEPFIGEDGLNYIEVTKEILTPRKTFLKGVVSGKYRGSKITEDYENADLYDFEIYEAKVICNSKDDFRKNSPFIYPSDFNNIDSKQRIKGTVFPKDKLPSTLPVEVTANNKTFGINLLKPKLYEFSIIRKLHQTDGDEVFGSFRAFISGYVLDYEREEIIETIGPIIISPPPTKQKPCVKSNIETGRTEHKANYYRKEYLCTNHKDHTLWSNWIYNGSKKPTGFPETNLNSGCWSEILGFIGILLGIAFLIAIFPSLIYLAGFYLVIFIIGWLAPYLKWFFRIIGIVLLFGFFSALFNVFKNHSYTPKPYPVLVDTRENNSVVPPDTTPAEEKTTEKWIVRFRKWQDYNGKIYEGKYKIKVNDYYDANNYKNNLSIKQSSTNNYDAVIYNLKEHDKTKLDHVYPLFDSIRKANKLNKIQFAEMVVTFVQDIPYAIILEKNCDSKLYNDQFTKDYLLNNKGKCDGNQRFGINTPIEFLTNLKGDCDTRALLLYTIFSYYNYDVAVLSSEFYGHSIIGINLPINGTVYNYNNQKYVLWETTAPNIKPGVIPNDISNLNNWRISLKSK